MLDSFHRRINYLRISVTDRCNLRCTYCMPADGIEWMPHDSILSLEEIYEFAKVAVDKGVNKIRITGGEPLVRKGIINLVKMIASLDGVNDLAMTTNGVYLNKYAQELKDAGLHRVNISLDTIDETDFNKITRVGQLQDVIKGIEAAKVAGLFPIKINCVIKNNQFEPHAQGVAKFCQENDLEVRFIKEMNLETGTFSQVIGGEGGHCASCNRLRLTASGQVMPCLMSEFGYSVRELGSEGAINAALGNKPESGSTNKKNAFYNIGG